MARKLESLLIFTNQFASMLRSQLPLVRVLENLAEETPQKFLRNALEDICEDVNKGMDFGEALEAHPDVFDPIYVNVVKAGMLSGRLAGALTQMSEYLTKADLTSRKVRAAISYPAFVIIAFFVVFNAMVFFILPKFAKMFSSFGKALPAPTQMLLSVGEVWQSYWYLILGFMGFAIFGFIVWINTSDGRYLWDKHKLQLPLVGYLWRMSALSRFLRTLAVQFHNEVSILAALELAAASTDNVFIEETVLMIRDDVERGRGISQAFREHEVFTGIILQMISSGEEAGTLDELLLNAAEYYERLLDNQIESVTGLINPILTIALGMGIAAMMIATFLPVFEMGGAIASG